MSTPADVKVGHVLLSLLRGLSDKAKSWVAILMAFGVTCGAMVHAEPLLRVAIAAVFVALVSPLWLRRGQE